MTCPSCKGHSCYLCGSEITDAVGYRHFCQHNVLPGEKCQECNKCVLWSDSSMDDAARLKMAEEVSFEDERFCVTGSWDDWKQLHEMASGEGQEGDSVRDGDTFTYALVMGPNRFEKFQIVRNGDWKQRIYPAQKNAGPAARIVFSSGDDAGHGRDWLVDGRDESTRPEDIGREGDRYFIQFTVRGFWMSLRWQREAPVRFRFSSWAGAMASKRNSLSAEKPVPLIRRRSPHEYFVGGSWSEWKQEKMELQEDETPIVFLAYAEVPADHEARFQIVRNGEWEQRIYPVATGDVYQIGTTSAAAGPDDQGHGNNWSAAKRKVKWRLRIALTELPHGALQLVYSQEKG